jgi:protein TonB
MNGSGKSLSAAGLAFVLAIHLALLAALWNHRYIAFPDEAAVLFVETIAAPPPRQREEAPQPPRPERRRTAPPRQHTQLVAEAPVNSPAELVAPPPAPTLPVAEAPPPEPAGPLTLGTEWSVSCPERSAPAYPPPSRRMGEEGMVVLRVELDEEGVVVAARVVSGSGFSRLDAAALAAVKTWRCTPARRDGQPVRAVALQPFRFVLQ